MINRLSKSGVFFAIAVLVAPVSAAASCDFASHEYRAELADPSEIKHIGVEIKKSRKWFKNTLSILTSQKTNIDPKYKDKMKATLTVRYGFGQCKYAAKVRQNGDLKDHIRLQEGGNVISSVNVVLKEGNILNAVRFKLLLPETRNGLNEVLGAWMLRAMGYIAPETFLVSADINGVATQMMFQENDAKELLERNLRREGPIFEGDESLIWGVNGLAIGALTSASLSRLTNGKWAAKGQTSTIIALEAFQRLQHAYLEFADKAEQESNFWELLKLLPNAQSQQAEDERYAVLLFAMNGSHALFPNNRKFYFNIFAQAFEPIYYDGNLLFVSERAQENRLRSPKAYDFFLNRTSPDALAVLGNSIKKLDQDSDFKEGFLRRAGPDQERGLKMFALGLPAVIERLKRSENELREGMGAARVATMTDPFVKRRQRYVERLGARDFPDFYVDKLVADGAERFTAERVSSTGQSQTMNLSRQDVVTMMSDNEYGGERLTIVESSKGDTQINYATQNFLGGQIVLSKGAKVDVDTQNQKMIVTQTKPDDWVLVRDVELNNWHISFVGLPQNPNSVATQRFNKYGLTGCLNFYNVTFADGEIHGTDGQCEDTINIVSSRGQLSELKVEGGFSDAIDIDFSRVSIDQLTVLRTGNDCFDVSTGTFAITKADLVNCGDKGISVGENSQFDGQTVFVTNAVIGVSSKDFSQTNIREFVGESVGICAEAFQKKQEFGGAVLNFDKIKCSGQVNWDQNSKISLGNE